MSTDKHFNEFGALPPALEDPKPTDILAAKTIWFAVLALLGFSLVILSIFYSPDDGAKDPEPNTPQVERSSTP